MASGAGRTAALLLDHGADVHSVDMVGDYSTALVYFILTFFL